MLPAGRSQVPGAWAACLIRDAVSGIGLDTVTPTGFALRGAGGIVVPGGSARAAPGVEPALDPSAMGARARE